MTLNVPAWVRDAITETHSARWEATLDPVSGPSLVLPITAGTLRVDGDAYPRSTCSLALGDLSLAPRSPSSPVLPFGSTVTLDYVLTSAAGDTLRLRAAPTMLVDTVTVDRGPRVGMTITGSDRSLAVDTDTYPTPTSLPTTYRTVSSAIAYLIRRTFPSAVILDAVGSSAYIGNGFTVDASPWSAIEDLADSVGADCYVDTADRFVIRPTPAIGTPLDTLATGPRGTIVSATSSVIRGYNRIMLTFRNASGEAVLGRWADESSGPLRVDGPYGRVTFAEGRDREATVTEANAAAARLARRTAGKVRDVSIEAVAAPWIEPGDTVNVTLPTGTDALVLTNVEHDLSGLAASRYTFRTDTLGPL